VTNRNPVLFAALDGLHAGLSVIPIRAIGEPWYECVSGKWIRRTDRKTGQPATYGPKIPCGHWEPFQMRQATPDHLEKYLADCEWGQRRGIAVVSGFNRVDALDFDDAPTWERFQIEAAADSKVSDILKRIAAGYFEVSPRGAPHFLYRCDDLSDGGPLARRPVIVCDGEVKKLKVLIETRGPGQIVVVAPTPGSCHPTGHPYVLKRGGFSTIATITPDERRRLFALARSFDEVPPDPKPESRQEHRPPFAGRPVDGEKPGAHFNRVCTIDIWRDMLATWRWEYIGAVSGREHCWVHAMATSSLSAHLTPAGSLLVLSTSTPLTAWTKEDPRTHTPFFVFAAVSHRGDLHAAARELSRVGYGSSSRRPVLVGGCT